MKRIVINPASLWSSAALVCWLVAGFAPVARAAFTGDFAPERWQLDANSYHAGTYLFVNPGYPETMRLTSASTPGFSDTLVALQAPYAAARGVLNFSWTLTANGNVGEPFGYFYVGSSAYALGLGSGSLTGIVIPTNTPLYFELLGNLMAGKSPAKLEIKGWEITVPSAPGLAITYDDCPPYPCIPDSYCLFSGSVSNAGNVALTNVWVGNDHSPVPVFIAAVLPPGAVSNFTSAYLVPANAGCSLTTTVVVSGQDQLAGACVSASATRTCPLGTNPSIQVTQLCPAIPASAGGVLTYRGIVWNTGHSGLTNVVVAANRPAPNTVVFTTPFLAAGAMAEFAGSYPVPNSCCEVWNTLGATGQDLCSGTAASDTETTVCPVTSVARLVVTKTCPTAPVDSGPSIPYSGIVSNAGTVSIRNIVVTTAQGGPAHPVLGPITLIPGQSAAYAAVYTLPLEACSWRETVTAVGVDVCTLQETTASTDSECPVIGLPRIAVTKDCPSPATPRGGLYTYTGRVSNVGNVTLTNVFVVNSAPSNHTPVMGPITLTPGASTNFTAGYPAPASGCCILDTLTASGQDRCSGSTVQATASTVCPFLTAPAIALVEYCPSVPVAPGGLFVFTGVVANTGDTPLADVYVHSDQPAGNTWVLGPISLAPGEWQNFGGSYVVPVASLSATNTLTATGVDPLAHRVVTASASCFNATRVLIQARLATGGFVNLSFPTQAGVVYKVQFSDTLVHPVWNDLQTVLGTGDILSVVDPDVRHPARFYRVVYDYLTTQSGCLRESD